MLKFQKSNSVLSEDLIRATLPDENERFVLFKCAGYMKRLLSIRPVYDRETLVFLLWVLRSDIQHLLHYMVEHNHSKKCDKIKADPNVCNLDPEYAVDYTKDLLIDMDKSVIPDMTSLINNLLEKQEESLSCHGASLIEKKISTLKKMFNLTEHESEFATFSALITLWEQPEKYFANHLALHYFGNRKYLTKMLEINNSDLERILEGTLSRIKFLEADGRHFAISTDFINFFLKQSEKVLSRDFYKKMALKTIPLAMHMIENDETIHVLNLLKKKPLKSTHILIYGAPGTGKTSYAKGLIKELKLTGYDIAKNNENESRFRRTAILACCNMTKEQENTVIVVDEADNLLNTCWSWIRTGETQDKGWLNQLLEENGIRMIWITNSIDDLEDSVKRRFAYSIHFKPFNSRQRIQLWESILKKNRKKKLFNTKEVVDLAKKYDVSAGVIDLAIQKTRETYPHVEHIQYKLSIIRFLEAHLTLAYDGHRPIKKDRIEDQYSLDALNVQGNLTDMMEQLTEFDRYLRQNDKSRPMNMNLLFYGQPGTGKSELAKYIAQQLNRDFFCKRASDIIDPYIGRTERKIRAMFERAESDDAVLVIDEADSFIFSRDRAMRSWEISFTNEFLTQMEKYNGILICTTNRLTDLDSASMRRFSHKIEFRYLSQAGCTTFYKMFLSPLTDERIPESITSMLGRMNNLTPGDFKVARDKNSFMDRGRITHKILLEALEAESLIKQNHRSIGF